MIPDVCLIDLWALLNHPVGLQALLVQLAPPERPSGLHLRPVQLQPATAYHTLTG